MDFVFNLKYFYHLHNITTKLCGANEAQRSLRPNERFVMYMFQFFSNTLAILLAISSNLTDEERPTVSTSTGLYS